MIIDVYRKDGPLCVAGVKNYDFYPETKILFAECDNGKVIYIPICDKVQSVEIYGGTEQGYLEGHDEAR